MNQVAERHISVFSKEMGAFLDDFSPLRETPLGLILRSQNASPCQQKAHVGRNGGGYGFPSTKPRNRRFQPWPQPKRMQKTGGWVTHPGHRSLQVEIL